MRMNRLDRSAVFCVLALFAIVVSPVRADHVPVAPEDEIEYRGRVAVVLDHGKFDHLFELQGMLQGEESEFRYRALTLGSYYRLHENLKVGAFYRLQQGARHDDDWIDLDPGWEWQDTRGRTEHLFMLDVSPRFSLDMLPGENWVFMLKNRYLFNIFNGHQSVLVRPGITWFWIADRQPLLNVSLYYELYLPLNFGSTPLYGYWPYLTLLYHASPLVALELTGAHRTVNWSTSEDVKASGVGGYEVKAESIMLGFGILFKFDAPTGNVTGKERERK